MREESPRLGAKVRAVRRQQGLTQAQLATRLGISASYLNLIEHDRRALSAPLLIRLADTLQLDMRALSPAGQERMVADLMEAVGDPLFDPHDVTTAEVRDLASGAPVAARAELALHRAYRNAQEASE